MLTKEFVLNDDIDTLGSNIKTFFLNGGEYVVIKNFNSLTDLDIINYYNELNPIIGNIVPVDLEKDTYKPTVKYWSDVKYEYGSDEKQFWRSSNHQNLHTDNSFAPKKYYSNLTQLVCLKPSEYSGNTTLISNEKIIELIKFNDKNNSLNMFDNILNKYIYFSVDEHTKIKKPILHFESSKNKYIFNFNYFPAKRAKNTEDDNKVIEELNYFLEEKIMCSNMMNEIKLYRGDAIIFNDELLMHGRRSFLGTRHYIKSGINIENLSLIDYSIYNVESML